MSDGDARAELVALGFTQLTGLLTASECQALGAQCGELPPGAAGSRNLLGETWCRDLVRRLRGHPALAGLLPAAAVQCSLFEKSSARNWLVSWHQDLSLPVARRLEVEGWSGWSTKQGQLFVQPPAALLAQCLALRLHLDPCGATDGPLQLLPGTQGFGRLDDAQIQALRPGRTPLNAVAAPGDALLMRPLLLHASSKSTGQSRRRVLHFLFGPAQLPGGLSWADAV